MKKLMLLGLIIIVVGGSFNGCSIVNRKTCDGGDARECIELALNYSINKDDKKANESLQKAVLIYQKSCESGDAEDCNMLGDIFHTMAEDDSMNTSEFLMLKKNATIAYRKACEGGYKDGCKKYSKMIKQ